MRPLRSWATLLLGVAAASPAIAQAECPRSPILVRNVDLWTGSGTVRRDVLFRDGAVAAVRPARSIRQQPGMRLLDGRGQTLLPGLIDLHLHIGVAGGLPESARPPLLANSEVTGRQLLRSGVTSGRIHFMSLAGAVRLRDLAAEPCAVLPRLQFGGPAMVGGSDDVANASYAGVRDASDIQARMRAAAEARLPWVAVYETHKFRPGELPALVDAARRNGVRLTVSGSKLEELEPALSAEIGTIDYIETSEAKAYPAALLARIRAIPGAAIVPTLGIHYRHHLYRRDPGLIHQPSHFEFMTEAEKAFVAEQAKAALTSSFAATTRRAYPDLQAKFRQLLSSGIPMGLGSDVGSEAHFHAEAIWWELEAWRTFGAAPRQALSAATTTAASILKDSRAGVIKPGAYADFVLYAGNPAKGAFDQKRVRAVGKDGVLFVRDGRWVGPPR